MNIPNYLAEHDIKPSYQRIRIFEYLYQKMNHPTVDLIYKTLAPEIPTLSKTTVYNTLKLFVEKGITSTVTIEQNEVRYDALVEEHGHFKCNICGEIKDIPLEIEKLKISSIKNISVEQTQVHLIGKCNKCLTQ
ncbi:MAG: transcriptional repressor [Flavobacteriales bacterium]|nr:transcriptional repressor [Flavobacteriales bacterium]